MAVKETRRSGSKKRKKGSQKVGRRSKKGSPSRRGWTDRFREIGGPTAEAKIRVAGGEDWGGERVRDSGAQTLVADPGTGQLGSTGRQLQKQERLRQGRGE